MREIKFRAWDKEAEHMVYSDKRDYKKRDVEYDFDVTNGNVICKWEQDIEDGWGYCNPHIEDIDNIMEYTGRKDRKGREVYEGDRVKVYSRENEYASLEEIREVAYENACFVLKAKDGRSVALGDYKELEIEVVGNIYENAEIVS